MSYEGLLNIIRSSAEEMRQALDDEVNNPQACPNDGEPLTPGPDGLPHCKFDGWRPTGAPQAGETRWS